MIDLPKAKNTVAETAQPDAQPVERVKLDPIDKTMDEITKDELIYRMNKYKANKTIIAASLGVTIKTIYNWLDNYGIKYDGQ